MENASKFRMFSKNFITAKCYCHIKTQINFGLDASKFPNAHIWLHWMANIQMIKSYWYTFTYCVLRACPFQLKILQMACFNMQCGVNVHRILNEMKSKAKKQKKLSLRRCWQAHFATRNGLKQNKNEQSENLKTFRWFFLRFYQIFNLSAIFGFIFDFFAQNFSLIDACNPCIR